ncbi:glycosyltransferase family 2 protein [Pseudomonas sp. SWRI99]|uniref:glycosyltransferase family 2 protein n=1 Tax=Pseudomonas sp. SWRI99 TaxID=2745506 RepID=UPI0016474F0A|nr:glycosyltransferase family 2 protein [Pseudomonas sp. SWRI99]MBC3775845.1 glycosyltransferase family 2 protein [Pseudomonas sp. SWRI99]
MTLPSETRDFHQTGANRRPSPSQPSVAILLCTFNGARFLAEQIDSILMQTHTNWVIHASDDGSCDSTVKLLEAYQKSVGPDRLRLYQGPQLGFAQNFISLIKNNSIEADYFAFSDQDDIWHPTKLEKGLKKLQKIDHSNPALYCTRVRLIDTEQRCVGFSPLRKNTPSFENALVQSLAGANTMLINQSARTLMAAIPDNTPVVAHDWLAYLLVTASAGQVIYDSTPSLDYRQHEGNLIGNRTGLSANFHRIKRFVTGDFSIWNDMNSEILDSMLGYMPTQNHTLFSDFKALRTAGLVKRTRLFFKVGLYRQGPLENLLLILALVFKKI